MKYKWMFDADYSYLESVSKANVIEIYHYTSTDGLLGIIQRDGRLKLWFTRYDSLNDRTERKEFLEQLYSYCDQKLEEGSFSEEFYQIIKNIDFSDRRNIATYKDETFIIDGREYTGLIESRPRDCDTYLCCFSEDKDSLAMWNYYTKSNQYSGYSIGVFSDQLADVIDECSIQLKRVIYDDNIKKNILDKLLIPCAKEYPSKDKHIQQGMIRFIKVKLEEFQYVFKNSCFAHEKEIRAILYVPRDFKGNDVVSSKFYRNNNGIITPYVELTRELVVTDLVVGPLTEIEVAQRNLKEFLTDSGQNGVKIIESKVPIRF